MAKCLTGVNDESPSTKDITIERAKAWLSGFFTAIIFGIIGGSLIALFVEMNGGLM